MSCAAARPHPAPPRHIRQPPWTHFMTFSISISIYSRPGSHPSWTAGGIAARVHRILLWQNIIPSSLLVTGLASREVKGWDACMLISTMHEAMKYLEYLDIVLPCYPYQEQQHTEHTTCSLYPWPMSRPESCPCISWSPGPEHGRFPWHPPDYWLLGVGYSWKRNHREDWSLQLRRRPLYKGLLLVGWAY